MWEFSLACNNKNKDIIDYINNCFCKDLPDCMLTTYQDEHFSYLLFASDESIKSICQAKIKHCVATYIIDIYKYEFFLNKIKGNNNLVFKAYIKALTLYDVDTDIALINALLDADRQLHIDSFIQFKMPEIVRMWQELCELITSNSNYLTREVMLDVMKSFISTYNQGATTLKILVEKDSFVLYKLSDNSQPLKLKDRAEALDIINYTLLSNPKHIEIYGDITRAFQIISLLKALYDDKVEVIN